MNEQQLIKDANDSLRNMIRSKCATNSELLMNGSTDGTPDPFNAAEIVAESVQKITIQLAGNRYSPYDRSKPLPPKQETYAF